MGFVDAIRPVSLASIDLTLPVFYRAHYYCCISGMLLLFNEPFTPGDTISFKVNKQEITGRVEQIGTPRHHPLPHLTALQSFPVLCNMSP